MSVAAYIRARDALRAADKADRSAGEVCEELASALHEVASFTWCAIMTTDPETMLPSGGVVEGFAPEDCVPFWDNELGDPDFNKFTELARRIDPVATLHDAVDGDLERSPRYTKLYQAIGAGDELRIVLGAGGSTLAVGVLVRRADEGPFTTEELTDVRALVPVASSVLRRALGRIAEERTRQPPVVIMLDVDGEVTSMSAGGQEVLEDLRIHAIDGDFPGVVHVAATKARRSGSTTTLTTRLRGRSGRWLRLQVTPMDGGNGAVALVVETASSDDMLRIRLDSYDLTPRETEIVVRLCRGLTTKEIGNELLISAHTVRDHVKAIYEKAGVNSRGELVADLFCNQVLDRLHDVVAHLGSRRG